MGARRGNKAMGARGGHKAMGVRRGGHEATGARGGWGGTKQRGRGGGRDPKCFPPPPPPPLLSGPITSVCFSKDGQCVLAASLDSTLRLLDKETGEMLGE